MSGRRRDRGGGPEAAGRISFDAEELPFPPQVSSASLAAALGELRDTPLADGVADAVDRFRRLLASGLVSTGALDRA
jgi:hypothetical protein